MYRSVPLPEVAPGLRVPRKMAPPAQTAPGAGVPAQSTAPVVQFTPADTSPTVPNVSIALTTAVYCVPEAKVKPVMALPLAWVAQALMTALSEVLWICT